MIENKQSNFRHRIFTIQATKSKIDCNHSIITQSLSSREKRSFKSPLPKFFNWLKRRIYSGDKRFALGAQDFILYKPSQANEQLIFIVPEVFDQYYRYSGVSKSLIQEELKKKLMITFAYTIVRDEKVMEVFPCKKFF